MCVIACLANEPWSGFSRSRPWFNMLTKQAMTHHLVVAGGLEWLLSEQQQTG